jgi:hypothetical protein
MTIRIVFAKLALGNLRLLEDISDDTHWTSNVTKNGQVSAEKKKESNISISSIQTISSYNTL